MTQPREILPGRTYLVSRRCTQREFLLRPDDKTNEIFLYCLADAAQRFGIELIAWCAMSNHWHGVVHDPRGELPAFLERFHKLTAKALNARWGRWENLWASEQTCAVHLVEQNDVFEKVIYSLANPVADNLVDRAFDWPGASSLVHMTGRPRIIRRPKVFFRDSGPMPHEITLVAKPPRDWKGDGDSWAEVVHAAVRARENAARQERIASGRRVVGRRRIVSGSAFSRPTTQAHRHNLRPSIACKNAERRLREVAALRLFRATYRRALEHLVAGDHAVLFPAGTYKLRRCGLVRCKDEPSPAL